MGKVQCVVAGLGLTAAMAIGCAEHHDACAPGEIAACSCSDGRLGAMRCGSASMFAPCVCSGGSCVAGTEVACTCADGTSGLQWCGPGGVPGACACASGGCVPGRSVACACSSGASGAQLCNTDGRFGMCACDSTFDAARLDAGSVTLLDTGSTTPVDTGPRPDTAADAPPFDAGSGAGLCPERFAPSVPTLPRPAARRSIASGTGRLVGAFVSEHGIIVVTLNEARLLNREGVELSRWTSSREITTAAFAEGRLAIADRAVVTYVAVRPEGLVEVTQTRLTEECASGAMVTCGRFVCGPPNDSNRVFYTYDLEAGREIMRTVPETYHGIPMRRVPGRDAFISVTLELSPSDFYYHRVERDGAAVYITETPYHGDFQVSEVYAFAGAPATHLVTQEGRMLSITTCHDGEPGAWDLAGCFVNDGALGTLRSGETFVALESGSDGRLYGLVTPSIGGFYDPVCTISSPCRIQRIDVDARRVMSEATFVGDGTRDFGIHHDAWSGMALIEARFECGGYPFACTGWVLHLLPYE